MRRLEKHTHVIAIGECSAAGIGLKEEWLETSTFPKDTPIADIIDWAKERYVSGRLTITIDERVAND